MLGVGIGGTGCGTDACNTHRGDGAAGTGCRALRRHRRFWLPWPSQALTRRVSGLFGCALQMQAYTLLLQTHRLGGTSPMDVMVRQLLDGHRDPLKPRSGQLLTTSK
jgi:hypothetical protein